MTGEPLSGFGFDLLNAAARERMQAALDAADRLAEALERIEQRWDQGIPVQRRDIEQLVRPALTAYREARNGDR